ncbi:MAG: molecular chaperone SurA [Gammaproteobacteria bacterium]|nr:MAG: molecular chaperone SurA [Gammaproteobacteria bacterium]
MPKTLLPTLALASLFLLSLTGTLPETSSHAEELDRIVAVVDNDVILQSELERQLQQVRARLEKSGARMPPLPVLERQVLERMIINRLQMQTAARAGITVNDVALDSAIRNIAAENGVSLEEFRSILEQDGYPFSRFREDIREQMTISLLRKRMIEERIVVTEREVDDYLANRQQQEDEATEYRLQHILIATPEGASPEETEAVRKKAEEVLEKLRGGADFSQMAMEVSDGQQALEGGDLGWRKLEQLPTLFSDLVPQMQPEQISDLIRSPSGFHIIRLAGVRHGEKVMIEQTHARHILIRPNELVSDQDAKARLEQLRERILNGEDFAELARAHSDDRGSALEGGDLGWASPGDFDPKFEQVMNELEPGEISEPFQTRFGWHIVQVLERRTHDSTEEVRRAQARKAIRDRKLNEELQSWLRRLRDEAYVEIRL